MDKKIRLCQNNNMNKKSYEQILNLNNTYSPLIKHANKCQQLVESKGINSKFVWANNHFEEYKGKYICESYPIPIIEIEGIGDIGFNIDTCFFEGYFSKEKLLSFDFEILKEVGYFALYGEKDYLIDIYNTNMKCNDINQLLQNSTENNIAIGFAFKSSKLDKIIELLIKLIKS